MDSSLLIGLEMAGVLGLALVWGGYELWTLRRYRQQEEKARQDAAQNPPTEPSSGGNSEAP